MSEDEEFEFRARAEQEAKQKASAQPSSITTPPADASQNVAAYGAQAAMTPAIGGVSVPTLSPQAELFPKPGAGQAVMKPGFIPNVAQDAAHTAGILGKHATVGEALRYVGKEGLTKSAAELLGAIAHPIADVTAAGAAKGLASGVVQGLMAPENLMTLPYNMAAYEQAKIRANPNAPQYATNPYGMSIRSQGTANPMTQGQAGALNQQRAVQQFATAGNPAPGTPQFAQLQAQEDAKAQQALANPNAGNFLERMKYLSKKYGTLGQ